MRSPISLGRGGEEREKKKEKKQEQEQAVTQRSDKINLNVDYYGAGPEFCFRTPTLTPPCNHSQGAFSL